MSADPRIMPVARLLAERDYPDYDVRPSWAAEVLAAADKAANADPRTRVERKVVVQGSETRGDYYTREESVNVTLYLMADGTVLWQDPDAPRWDSE